MMPPELARRLYEGLQATRSEAGGWLGLWEHQPRSVQEIFETLATVAWREVRAVDLV